MDSSLFPLSLSYAPAGSRSRNVLAELTFGQAGLAVPLRQLGAQPLTEQWSTDEAVEQLSIDGITATRSESMFFGYASERVSGADLDQITSAIYGRLAAATRAAGFSHPLRVWHHVPTINLTVDGLEQYRRFCVGRYGALQKLGYRLEDDLPSASAVGSHGDRLVIYFIAARHPGEQVENPRQISAYHYPAEYGPRSPSFARATLKRWKQGMQLFVSGTASIIGHESKHEADLDAQLDETVRNLEVVIAEGGRKAGLPLTLRDASALKVYLRNGEDYVRVRQRFEQKLSPSASVVYLEADICRAELLLEIEAFAEFPRSGGVSPAR